MNCTMKFALPAMAMAVAAVAGWGAGLKDVRAPTVATLSAQGLNQPGQAAFATDPPGNPTIAWRFPPTFMSCMQTQILIGKEIWSGMPCSSSLVPPFGALDGKIVIQWNSGQNPLCRCVVVQ